MNKGVDVSLQYQIWLRCRFVSVFFFFCVCIILIQTPMHLSLKISYSMPKKSEIISLSSFLSPLLLSSWIWKKKIFNFSWFAFYIFHKMWKVTSSISRKKKKGETGLSCSLPSEPSEVIAVLFVRHLSCCWVLLKRAWPHLLNSRPLDIYKHW